MPTTTYTLFAQTTKGGDFAPVEGDALKKKDRAIEAAKRLQREQRVGVEVRTGAGTKVFDLRLPGQRVITRYTPPFTRLERLEDGAVVRVPEGYEAAYRRSRNGTVLCRKIEGERGAEDLYAVINAMGELVGTAPTTRAGGKLMEGRLDAAVALGAVLPEADAESVDA